MALCLYSGSRYIDETLHSVFAQTFPDFETVAPVGLLASFLLARTEIDPVVALATE